MARMEGQMSVELRPLGVRCNIACQYCYQNPQRDAGNIRGGYDLEAMKRAILEENSPFTIFGGEALLIPEQDLEHLWAWGFERFGRNAVQTNGTLVTENHLRMFRQYNVQVGISVDGPGPLNDPRWVGSLEKTRAATNKTDAVITRLCQEDMPPCVIVTLHRHNATADKLPVMHEWFRSLDRLGVRIGRLHVLESEDEMIRATYGLTPEENIHALRSFAELERGLRSLRLDVFGEIDALLMGRDNEVSCVWKACDPYTTAAVRGVEGHGETSNCGRTNKEGIDFVKAESVGYERYLALYQTPQEHGGCQGCRFFLMCKGQCPGTAIDGDWRNRTEHCDVWKWLFEHAEERLVAQGEEPLSLSAERTTVEHAVVGSWAKGRNPNISSVRKLIGA